MSELTPLPSQRARVLELPQWVIASYDATKPSRYVREGMSDLVIALPPPRLNQDLQNEAKQRLNALEALSRVPVTMQQIHDLFSFVNGLVANPLGKDDFRFKVKAIYSLFSTYSGCIFNQDTAQKLATATKFFPSAHEIANVLNAAKTELEAKITLLKSVVGQAYRNPEKAAQKRQETLEQRLKVQEEQEYQHKLAKLKNRFKFIDDLTREIEQAVENYVPDNRVNMDFNQLIAHLTKKMNALGDPTIKKIFTEKIEALRSAQRQLEQLKRVGIVPVAV
ncbi:hypothetical protein COMNV_00602 [Commensalibacter sp. Nvir]|uniref:hypothetical protein n=1 Tax=Commensalibacter sp. Nvir TaxID=3069817 RepID=UPI002D63A07E|nr:hypothetical protein COMNV_00602 [Commensalibacter sp. Nvir]